MTRRAAPVDGFSCRQRWPPVPVCGPRVGSTTPRKFAVSPTRRDTPGLGVPAAGAEARERAGLSLRSPLGVSVPPHASGAAPGTSAHGAAPTVPLSSFVTTDLDVAALLVAAGAHLDGILYPEESAAPFGFALLDEPSTIAKLLNHHARGAAPADAAAVGYWRDILGGMLHDATRTLREHLAEAGEIAALAASLTAAARDASTPATDARGPLVQMVAAWHAVIAPDRRLSTVGALVVSPGGGMLYRADREHAAVEARVSANIRAALARSSPAEVFTYFAGSGNGVTVEWSRPFAVEAPTIEAAAALLLARLPLTDAAAFSESTAAAVAVPTHTQGGNRVA